MLPFLQAAAAGEPAMQRAGILRRTLFLQPRHLAGRLPVAVRFCLTAAHGRCAPGRAPGWKDGLVHPQKRAVGPRLPLQGADSTGVWRCACMTSLSGVLRRENGCLSPGRACSELCCCFLRCFLRTCEAAQQSLRVARVTACRFQVQHSVGGSKFSTYGGYSRQRRWHEKTRYC